MFVILFTVFLCIKYHKVIYFTDLIFVLFVVLFLEIIVALLDQVDQTEQVDQAAQVDQGTRSPVTDAVKARFQLLARARDWTLASRWLSRSSENHSFFPASSLLFFALVAREQLVGSFWLAFWRRVRARDQLLTSVWKKLERARKPACKLKRQCRMASWREKLLFPRGAGEIRSYHTEWEVPEFECLTSQWCTNVNHTSNWWQLTRPLQMDNVLRFYWGNSKFSVALLLEYNLFLDAEKQTAASKSYKPSQDLHTLNILQAQRPVVCYPKHYRVFRYLRPPPLNSGTVSIHTIYALLESKI